MEDMKRDQSLERLINNIPTPNTDDAGVILKNLVLLTQHVWPLLQCRRWVGVQPVATTTYPIMMLTTRPKGGLVLDRFTVSTRKSYLGPRCRWTFAPEELTESSFGFDTTLIKAMRDEFDQDILMRMRMIPRAPMAVFNPAKDDHHALAKMLSFAALEIASGTGRTGKDCMFAVVSKKVYEIAARHPLFADGKLHLATGWMRLDVDEHAHDNMMILVGYKGPSHVDAGFFWAPLTMIDYSHTMIDPGSLNPVMSFHTNRAYAEPCWQDFHARQYYRRIDVEG